MSKIYGPFLKITVQVIWNLSSLQLQFYASGEKNKQLFVKLRNPSTVGKFSPQV